VSLEVPEQRQNCSFHTTELSSCRRAPARLPSRGDSDHSWTLSRAEIEARNFDLKAINPTAKSVEDTRTPEEVLDEIEARGRNVAAQSPSSSPRSEAGLAAPRRLAECVSQVDEPRIASR
jgi:hypothetical protein